MLGVRVVDCTGGRVRVVEGLFASGRKEGRVLNKGFQG